MIDWEDEYKNLLDGFEKVESGLIPLKKHIRGIAEYFQSKGYEEVANWFWMSSSINSVEFDGIRYDSAFMMCRPAYEYEVEKQNLHSKLMTELTKFLYVYSGFEALLNTLNLPKCPNSVGKINAAKFFIKQNYTTTFSPLVCYNNTLSQLRNLIKASEMSEFEKYFSLDDCTDVNGVGLKVVYKLRNKLAHGDFAFPEPGDWTFKLPVEPEITYLSTGVNGICPPVFSQKSGGDTIFRVCTTKLYKNV
ncbi:hypothetical protein IT397_00425, partial [Candidatus Nomurabacteria bacterium]|nr:hypothetical protein [Candidatus Nomurabacteria bacterium]